jgi:hypothetical protein
VLCRFVKLDNENDEENDEENRAKRAFAKMQNLQI